LNVDDPLLAAHHFVGVLLWIPVNKAMFTGDHRSSPDELERSDDDFAGPSFGDRRALSPGRRRSSEEFILTN
jgi:hypothetical protein